MTQGKVLVVDVGGNNVKLYNEATGEKRRFSSGRELTPEKMAQGVAEHLDGWTFDLVSVGVPGPVREGKLLSDPANLGPGWTSYELSSMFERPTRLVNDAVLQAIGSYDGGKMLFLGLGTGLGAALVHGRVALPLEVAHLPYRENYTFEDCVGRRGLDRMKKKRWEKAVADVVERLRVALVADHVVLGGGNAKKLDGLPKACRLGANANVVQGGIRLWHDDVAVI